MCAGEAQNSMGTTWNLRPGSFIKALLGCCMLFAGAAADTGTSYRQHFKHTSSTHLLSLSLVIKQLFMMLDLNASPPLETSAEYYQQCHRHMWVQIADLIQPVRGPELI